MPNPIQGEICFHENGRLFWLCSRHVPLDTEEASFFSTDDVLVYDPYYGDFGPLNIAQLCRYCRMLEHKLSDPQISGKRIYHVCKPQTDTRANSILLCCAYLVVVAKKTPAQAWSYFANTKPALVPYRDASLGPPSYPITVSHCLQGLVKAIELGWYVHETFNPDEYEHYERVENGDFNWIVPGKFLAFSGPTQTPIAYVDGVKTNTPETYYDYFRANNVTGVVRFNNKVYDRKKFLDAGFNHYDLYFADGGNPTDAILKKFLDIAENEKGALAVHCKAGLGRTGTLISLFLMKHFLVTTPEIISWLRLCRPGSVIGPQQNFLSEMEKRMHHEGANVKRPNGARPGGGAPAMATGPDPSAMDNLSVSANGARSPSGIGAALGRGGVGAVPPASPTKPVAGAAPKGFGAATASAPRTVGAPAAARSPVTGSPLKQKAASLLKR